MEAGIFPWTPFNTTSPWAVPPVTTATPSVYTPRDNFTPSWQAVEPPPVCEWGCTQWNTVSALTAVGQALEAALQALVNYILSQVGQLMHTVIETITSAIGAYLGGVASSLSQLFQDFTASSPSATTILADSGSLLLSLFGIQSFVNSLSNVMSTVMSVVNPILNLISLNRLLSIISNALGAATGFNPLADIQSALNQVASGLFSAVADALTVPFSLLGIANDPVTVPSSQSEPFPTPTQAVASVNALVSSSGNSGLSGDFGSSTNPDPSAPELIDIVHIGVIVAIILLLVISGVFGVIENALQFFENSLRRAVLMRSFPIRDSLRPNSWSMRPMTGSTVMERVTAMRRPSRNDIWWSTKGRKDSRRQAERDEEDGEPQDHRGELHGEDVLG